MKCPNDDVTLVMSERSGIEIDYCPECRGVWLDRGELDKIIERAATEHAPAPAPAAPPAQSYERSYEQERDDRRTEQDQRYARASQQASQHPGQYGSQQPYRKKKKESWLSEIFD